MGLKVLNGPVVGSDTGQVKLIKEKNWSNTHNIIISPLSHSLSLILSLSPHLTLTLILTHSHTPSLSLSVWTQVYTLPSLFASLASLSLFIEYHSTKRVTNSPRTPSGLVLIVVMCFHWNKRNRNVRVKGQAKSCDLRAKHAESANWISRSQN